MGKNMEDDKRKLTAAILTLSDTMEGLFSILRKDLQFRVEVEENKIVEDFLPDRMSPTKVRFERFQKILEELENSEILPLEIDETIEKKVRSDSHYTSNAANKMSRDEEHPPEEYGVN